jgi:hypothetical protein
LWAALVLVALVASPAVAAKKKTVTEEWQVTAVPFPGADDHMQPDEECGVEDVSYAVHAFETPGRGTLEAAITDFQGEWDLYLTDSDGNVLASSVNFMAGSEERLVAALPARTEVSIYACNFAGGPTANGRLKYVYKP